jgi:hypothetical protein
MYTTDFEKKLNLLIRAIEKGEVNEREAKERLNEVLGYAIHDRERIMANEKFSVAMIARFGSSATEIKVFS